MGVRRLLLEGAVEDVLASDSGDVRREERDTASSMEAMGSVGEALPGEESAGEDALEEEGGQGDAVAGARSSVRWDMAVLVRSFWKISSCNLGRRGCQFTPFARVSIPLETCFHQGEFYQGEFFPWFYVCT